LLWFVFHVTRNNFSISSRRVCAENFVRAIWNNYQKHFVLLFFFHGKCHWSKVNTKYHAPCVTNFQNEVVNIIITSQRRKAMQELSTQKQGIKCHINGYHVHKSRHQIRFGFWIMVIHIIPSIYHSYFFCPMYRLGLLTTTYIF
jgi:hypothetical protein